MARPRKDTEAFIPMRACHDCGKPTRDYRCPACQKKHLAMWRKAQGIRERNTTEEEDFWRVWPPLQFDFQNGGWV